MLVCQSSKVPTSDPKRYVEPSLCGMSQNPGETLSSALESMLVPQTSKVPTSDPKGDVEPSPCGTSQNPGETLTSTLESMLEPQTSKVLTSDPERSSDTPVPQKVHVHCCLKLVKCLLLNLKKMWNQILVEHLTLQNWSVSLDLPEYDTSIPSNVTCKQNVDPKAKNKENCYIGVTG